MPERELATWFWRQVDQSAGPAGCWPWIGRLDRLGYGRYTLARTLLLGHSRQGLAHRLAVVVAGRELGPAVRHSCDNPPCCNPLHLTAGTQADNLHDMWRKGRGFRPAGEAHPQARLSEADVRMIREADLTRYGSQISLARSLGVTRETIREIRIGKRWSHLERSA